MFKDKIRQHNIEENNFSMLHANIRSAQKNLASLEHYINNLDHTFTVIGISESWFKDHSVDRYGIEGYNGVHTFRPIRSGGGVSIFVQNSVEYFVRTDLCYLNTPIETIFIEIDKEQIGKDKNEIIGVIYRPPDTDIKIFNEYMSELLDKMKSENKCIACLGDFNISLLNSDCHEPTQEFADLMYSCSLFPCITKPTRVTSKTASLINNIFCNNIIENQDVFTGILFTDISDNFPIFYIEKATASKSPPKYLKNAYIHKNVWDYFPTYFITMTGLKYYLVTIPRMPFKCFQIVIGTHMTNVSHPGL